MNIDAESTAAPGFGERFATAMRRFDAENARDPNQELVDGVPRPRELVYAERLSAWVMRLAPDASEVLRLAARCQHICRWSIPRDQYAANRAGYLRWREDLKKFHARKAGEILKEAGYAEATITRVQALNLKSDFPHDPESRVLEDALCLVFLQYQLPELAARAGDDKLINALQKTWKKMTPDARRMACEMRHGPKQAELIARAIHEEG
jgi:hypothetical protein